MPCSGARGRGEEEGRGGRKGEVHRERWEEGREGEVHRERWEEVREGEVHRERWEGEVHREVGGREGEVHRERERREKGKREREASQKIAMIIPNVTIILLKRKI